MDSKRKWIALILALVLILSMAGTVSASGTREPADCIRQIINYYRYYQFDADTELDCLFYELEKLDPAKAQTWEGILDYWNYVNSGMTIYPDVLPDGLPQDNTLCIVVMGYALASDGSMKSELIGRLEAALASAEKYPNAYIVCTGGGTARNNKSVTEAGKMSQWLINRGVSPDRIIVESSSKSTVSNAINTCKILATDYPRVTHLALITSDYHLPRSCLLFHTQAILKANQGAPLLIVAANAAYTTGREPESIEIQSDDLSALANASIHGMKKPDRVKLEYITAEGNTQFYADREPALKVIAHYTGGLFREVSNGVKYAGIDFAATGMQELTVNYEEGGIEVSITTQIELLPPETTAPTEAPTEAPTDPPAPVTEPEPATEAPTEPTKAAPMPEDNAPTTPGWIMPTFGTLLLLIVILLLMKRQVNREKTKKDNTVQDETLAEDDSPFEYI